MFSRRRVSFYPRPYGEGDITHSTVAGSVVEAFAQVCGSRGEDVLSKEKPGVSLQLCQLQEAAGPLVCRVAEESVR